MYKRKEVDVGQITNRDSAKKDGNQSIKQSSSASIKLRGHDTFSIRNGWLRKGLVAVSANEKVFSQPILDAAVDLGIGVNMVKALRYWLTATGLIFHNVRGSTSQALTPLGEMVLKYDPHFEKDSTLQLLHYNLVSGTDATSWSYFFNNFDYSEFSGKEFVSSMTDFYYRTESVELSLRLIEDDWNCITNTYCSSFKDNDDPENNNSCPLTRLELVQQSPYNKKLFRKTPDRSLNPFISAYIISQQHKDMKEILLQDLLKNDNSIGKVFNLDSIALLEVLSTMEMRELLKINRTAGLDVVNIRNSYTIDELLKKGLDD